MKQKDFQEVLRRYRLGQASREEEKMINEWYNAIGEQPWDDARPQDEIENRAWTTITSHITNTRVIPFTAGKRKSKVRWLEYSVGIAASVMIAVVSFFYFRNAESQQPEIAKVEGHAPSTWEQVTNTSNMPMLFALPDGSRVTLAPESNLKFLHSVTTSAREVYLEGEGFFEVIHNEQRPFLVYAHNVTTKVLGTAFTVKAIRNDINVTVAVKTGRVSVSTGSNDNEGTKEFVVTPNQQIIYNTVEAKIAWKIVDAPLPILSPDELKRMRFEEVPVKDIFEAIERAYGVDIEFDPTLFSSCTLTTSVTDGDLYNRLGIVTRAIGVEYTIKENQIVIIGTGCN